MTKDQRALVDKAEESARAAELLSREEHHGFAVSRAYYAMFYCAEALLDADGLAFTSHAAVVSAFGQHFTKTGRVPPELHRHLIQAQDSRLLGDYDAESPRSQEEAAKHIGRAREFIKLAQRTLGQPADPV